MKKAITISESLLEQVRSIPGAAGLTDAQAVALFLEAGMEHARKDTALEALQVLMNDQGADFSDMVLEYARALYGMDATTRGYLHDTAMSAARLPQKHVRPAWIFIHGLSGKKVGA